MYFLKKYRRGIKNHYRENMPWPEKLGKDFLFTLLEIKNFILGGFKKKTVLAYPDFPSKKTTLYKICKGLHYNITNRLDRPFDLVVYYEDSTYRKHFAPLEKLGGNQRIINLWNRNIDKDFIDQAHLSVFDYNTGIDPLNFNGEAVQKSLINAKHDGKLIDCPINQKEEGFIYQRLILNEDEKGVIQDFRVPVMGGEIPLAYIKRKKKDIRFTNIVYDSSLVKMEDLFSGEEQAKILEFCAEIKLEYGEMDILRDRESGLIYIIDVNNTPFGPPKGLTPSEDKKALGLLSESFKREFLGDL